MLHRFHVCIRHVTLWQRQAAIGMFFETLVEHADTYDDFLITEMRGHPARIPVPLVPGLKLHHTAACSPMGGASGVQCCSDRGFE